MNAPRFLVAIAAASHVALFAAFLLALLSAQARAAPACAGRSLIAEFAASDRADR